MLDKVVARSRPVDQLVENREGPKGLAAPSRLALWGMEPARIRAGIDELPLSPATGGLAPVSIPETPDPGGRKGLVEGLGRDVLDRRGWWALNPLWFPPGGGNLDGTVPARARRAGLLMIELSEAGTRSGNPS